MTSYLKAAIMKILKNLFGSGDRIHSDNIEVGTSGNHRNLSDSVIVESGSNANGKYIKYGDGTMIVFARKPFEGEVLGTTHSFPAPFIDVGSVSLTAQVEGIVSGGTSTTYMCEKVVDSIWSYRIKAFNVSSGAIALSSTGTLVSITAIGRWK